MDSLHAALEQGPFDPGVDARYVYLSKNLERFLVALLSAIGNGKERLLITGGEGAGKSAFLWKLAEVLYDSGEFALLGQEMVFSCHRDTPLEAIETAVRQHALLQERESVPPAVLLLDDADRLDPSVLINLWQQWPTLNEGRPSICVVMSAMPRPKQLHGRGGHEVMAAEQTFALPPLEPADVGGLIRHRLQVAGLSGMDLFSPDALERIDYFSKRVPGRIVQLCGYIFNKSKGDMSLPVSEEAVKEAAYDLFLPGHLQKLARGLSSQPKPFLHGVGNTELEWNAEASASGRRGHEHDARVPHGYALGRRLGKRITMLATPPAAAGRPSQRIELNWRPQVGVRSLASLGVVLLLVVVTVFLAFGGRHADRARESTPEAAVAPSGPAAASDETAFAPEATVAPSDPATASHETEPAPDARRDRNAAGATEDFLEGPASRVPAPAASLPQVTSEATGASNLEQTPASAAADQALATVEPRRPPLLVELNNIALAQSRLNALGYKAGAVDGVVGPRTRAAIRRFQADAGLPVDGKISDPLITALRRQSTKSNFRTQGREKPRRRILPGPSPATR